MFTFERYEAKTILSLNDNIRVHVVSIQRYENAFISVYHNL